MRTRKINAWMKPFKLWEHCSEVVREHFIKSMRGLDKKMTQGELQVQFYWFVEGWKAADIQRIRDGLTNINTDPPPQPFVY